MEITHSFHILGTWYHFHDCGFFFESASIDLAFISGLHRGDISMRRTCRQQVYHENHLYMTTYDILMYGHIEVIGLYRECTSAGSFFRGNEKILA